MLNQIFIVIVFLVSNFLLEVVHTAEPPIFHSDLQGKYCEARTQKCCSGRQDDCSAPILGTRCYCDDFCNRTRNDDCCPDYWTYCKGLLYLEPIIHRTCEKNGNIYKDGDVFKINCNTCKCQEVNDLMDILCENNICLVDDELLERINGNYRHYGWRASNYSSFWGRRYEDGLSLRLGTLEKPTSMSPIIQIYDSSILPRSFDARVTWSGMISKPRDQGWCGASWIFSTVAVASDRFAVMSYGNDNTFLSPQQLLNCNKNQRGCDGGYLTRAWNFIRKYGLVPETCYPWVGKVQTCQIKRYRNQFETFCPASSNKINKADLHRVGPAYRISGEQDTMYEIFKSGPVQALLKVSRDFFSYSGGIYKCVHTVNDERVGFHSVRIIGWGEELQRNQLVKYWIVSNSWGEWWGENGFFRIRRGQNDCLIEEYIVSAWANLEDFNTISDIRKHSKIKGNS